MKTKFTSILSLILVICLVVGCARDLSNNVYTSDETMNLVLEGTIISTRPVVIQESDKLSGNSAGMLTGGVAGGAIGATAAAHSHNYSNSTALLIGGVLVGALVGAVVEGGLSKADGIEYIIKVDGSKIKDNYFEGSQLMRNAISAARTTGLLNIVQGIDNPMNAGQHVLLILSPKRARIVAIK